MSIFDGPIHPRKWIDYQRYNPPERARCDSQGSITNRPSIGKLEAGPVQTDYSSLIETDSEDQAGRAPLAGLFCARQGRQCGRSGHLGRTPWATRAGSAAGGHVVRPLWPDRGRSQTP